MKRFVSLILVVLMSLSLTACGGNENKKLIEAGKNSLAVKQYEEALNSFKEAIDNGSKDEEVSKLYNIIKNYIDAKVLYDQKDYAGAAKILNHVDVIYNEYAIKEDMDTLIKQNKKELDYSNESDVKLESIEKFISEEKYIEADTIVSELEKRELNDAQKEKLDKLKETVKSNLTAEEEKEAEKEESLNNSLQNSQTNNAGSNNSSSGNSSSAEEDTKGPVTSREQAVEITKIYLGVNEGYVPGIIRVDSEDETYYNLQACDVIDDGEGVSHTTTFGWYTVNKSTGEVKSTF